MSAASEKLELLQSLAPFSSCSRKELELVGRLTDLVRVDAGRVLVREGNPGHEFFVIARGDATVSRGGRDVAGLRRGDCFGELSILTRSPRNATITASTPMELVVIEERAFTGLLTESPSFGRRIVDMMARRLQDTDLGEAASQPS
jgi:CRP-like cAMP-binding protein